MERGLKRILIIEDDSELREALKDNLEAEGYEVIASKDGEEGLSEATRHRLDAIILDVMLPRLSGFAVCRSLKERGVETPILMLTARAQESDKVLGLELGADDYVTKPFGILEFLTRVRVMIRRANAQPHKLTDFRFCDVELNFRQQQAWKRQRKIPLSSLEFEVLRYLILRRGHIVSRDQLLNEVWGYRALGTTRAVDNLVARLRQKLEDDPHDPRHILTVHGVGYKFVE